MRKLILVISLLLIPLLSLSQTNLIKSTDIKKDTVTKTVTMPYSVFLNLDIILENYLLYKKIENNNKKIDSITTSVDNKFSKILENSSKIEDNYKKNNEKLLAENLDLSNKVDKFAKQNKNLKLFLYPTAAVVLTKWVLIPSIKNLLNK